MRTLESRAGMTNLYFLASRPPNLLAWPSSQTTNRDVYAVALRDLFSSSELPLVHPEVDVLQQLSRINWPLVVRWLMGYDVLMSQVEAFFQKVCFKILVGFRNQQFLTDT